MEIKPRLTQLNSGLRIVSVPMVSESLTVMAMVGTGSRNEADEAAGVSHFLEHYVSNGTRKYKDKKDLWRVVEGVGGVRNAYTNKEVTAYWVKVAKEHLDLALEVTSELVCRPLLPVKYLAKEKGIILEELKMYEDQPDRMAVEKFENLIFEGSGLGRDIIGDRQTISEMTTARLSEYWQEWYGPEKMVIGVAGGIGSQAEIVKKVKAHFAELGKSGKFKPQTKLFGFRQEKPRVLLVKKPTEQAHLVLGLRSVKRDVKERYVLAVLNGMLGGMASSRLFQAVREEKGLAYYVSSYREAFLETGYWAVAAGVKKEDIEAAIELIIKELKDFVGKKKPKLREVERAKAYIEGVMKLKLETSTSVVEWVVEDLVVDGRARTLKERIAGVEAVKLDEVIEEAEKLLDEKSLNLSVVGPFEDKKRFESLLRLRPRQESNLRPAR